MRKETTAEKTFENIRNMISGLPHAERKEVADKIIFYLLFENSGEEFAQKAEALQKFYSLPHLTEEELQMIKELSVRTENLKNLLGEDPYFFM